jgi:hypothetical protein
MPGPRSRHRINRVLYDISSKPIPRLGFVDTLSRWKHKILTAVVFVLFLSDILEFLLWKFERILGPFLRR